MEETGSGRLPRVCGLTDRTRRGGLDRRSPAHLRSEAPAGLAFDSSAAPPSYRCPQARDCRTGGWRLTRKFMECRELPSERRCSVAIAADDDVELLEAAVQHAVAVHQERDTPELRREIKRHCHDIP